MSVAKITVSIETDVLRQLDKLVKERVYSNRSQAVQVAVGEKLARLNKTRLARACELLDPVEEKAFAELGTDFDLVQLPEYE